MRYKVSADTYWSAICEIWIVLDSHIVSVFVQKCLDMRISFVRKYRGPMGTMLCAIGGRGEFLRLRSAKTFLYVCVTRAHDTHDFLDKAQQLHCVLVGDGEAVWVAPFSTYLRYADFDLSSMLLISGLHMDVHVWVRQLHC